MLCLHKIENITISYGITYYVHSCPLFGQSNFTLIKLLAPLQRCSWSKYSLRYIPFPIPEIFSGGASSNSDPCFMLHRAELSAGLVEGGEQVAGGDGGQANRVHGHHGKVFGVF